MLVFLNHCLLAIAVNESPEQKILRRMTYLSHDIFDGKRNLQLRSSRFSAGMERFAARCIASRIAMARFIEAITVLGSGKVKLRIAHRGMKVFNEILKGSATSFKKVSNDKGHFTVHSLPLRSVTSLFGVRSFVLFLAANCSPSNDQVRRYRPR